MRKKKEKQKFTLFQAASLYNMPRPPSKTETRLTNYPLSKPLFSQQKKAPMKYAKQKEEYNEKLKARAENLKRFRKQPMQSGLGNEIIRF